MTRRTLYFTDPGRISVESEPIPEPGPEQVLVRSIVSAISSGTERLIYRGEAPRSLSCDSTIDALDDDLSFPLTYGYATVGRITAVGTDVDDDWIDRRVFAYTPHQSHFVTTPTQLVPVPPAISTRAAAMMANMETAVTFLLDGRPLIGERVVVFGQGVVGLLTTALLAKMPLETLVTVDGIDSRRRHSLEFGADRALDVDNDDVASLLEQSVSARADLVYELTGDPATVNDAISVTTFDGRIIVGSWYGTKTEPLELGRRFHRERIDLQSSQVSTIDPSLEGRWDRTRRHEVAWDWLERLPVTDLVTHEIPIERAATAYHRIDTDPVGTLQVLLTYD